MKTKSIIAILLALPIMACYTGCKSEDELTAKPAKETLRVLDGVINIQSDVENTNVNVTADCHWKVDSLDTGDFGKNLNVQPREGIGDGILQVTTDQNTTNADRTAKFILVSDGGLRQKITITQNGKGDGINLSKGSFNFETNPTEAQSLTITSNTSWKIEEANGAKWIHFEPESGGSGTTSVQIRVDASSTDATRSTSLNVKYGASLSKMEEVTVSQAGISNVTLQTNNTTSDFESYGGENIIHVESNAQWYAFIPSTVSWLSFNSRLDSLTSDGSASHIGSGDIHLVCDENTTTRERSTAVVIVAGTKSPKQVVVTVEQVRNGSALPLQTSVSLSELSVTRNSANFLVNIVSEEVVGDYGLLYSTSDSIPTSTNGNRVVIGKGGTSSGIVYELTGLKPETKYYVRAFVEKTNSNTYYSDVIAVTTMDNAITIGELRSMYVGNTYADMRFSFVADEEATDYGFVYSTTNREPSRADGTMVIVGSGTKMTNVMTTIADLEEQTTYYIRGYVQTKQGIFYSPNMVTITTSASTTEPGSSDNPDPQFARRK